MIKNELSLRKIMLVLVTICFFSIKNYGQQTTYTVSPSDPSAGGNPNVSVTIAGDGCFVFLGNNPIGITFWKHDALNQLLWFRIGKRNNGTVTVDGSQQFTSSNQMNLLVVDANGNIVHSIGQSYTGSNNSSQGDVFIDISIPTASLTIGNTYTISAFIQNSNYTTGTLTLYVGNTVDRLETSVINNVTISSNQLQTSGYDDSRITDERYHIQAAGNGGQVPMHNAECGMFAPLYNQNNLSSAISTILADPNHYDGKFYYISKRTAMNPNSSQSSAIHSLYSKPFLFQVFNNGSVTPVNRPLYLFSPTFNEVLPSGTNSITFSWGLHASINNVRFRLFYWNNNKWHPIKTSNIPNNPISYTLNESDLTGGASDYVDGQYKWEIKVNGSMFANFKQEGYFNIGTSNNPLANFTSLQDNEWTTNTLIQAQGKQYFSFFVPNDVSAIVLKLDGTENGSNLNLYTKANDVLVSSTNYHCRSIALDNKEMILIDHSDESRGFKLGTFSNGSSSATFNEYLPHSLQNGQLYYVAVKNHSNINSNFKIKVKFIRLRTPLNKSNVYIAAGYNDPDYDHHHNKLSSHYALDFNYYKNSCNNGNGKDDYGIPVLSTSGGYVMDIGHQLRSAGNYVRIYHGDENDLNTRWINYSSVYYHLDGINVQEGQTVLANQEIATIGTTGCSFGSHLHYEINRHNDNITAYGAYTTDRKGIKPEPLITNKSPTLYYTNLRDESTSSGTRCLDGNTIGNPNGVVIVDNATAFYSHTTINEWDEHIGYGYNNQFSYITNPTNLHAISWVPNLTIKGNYNVYVYIPCHVELYTSSTIHGKCSTLSNSYEVTTNMSNANVRYIINHKNKQTCIEVDQGDDAFCSNWVFLGNYKLDPNKPNDGLITLSTDEIISGNRFAVDAVMYSLEEHSPHNNLAGTITCNRTINNSNQFANIVPNPAINGIINIQWLASNNYRIDLYNLQGNHITSVYEQNPLINTISHVFVGGIVTNGHYQLRITNLSTGTYQTEKIFIFN